MLLGFHHITAIAGNPEPNLEFYTQFLGRTLVKRTVNFDDPATHHFYFGDNTGSLGTLLTFFPWAESARRARKGSGTITSVGIAVQSLRDWQQRAAEAGIPSQGPSVRDAFEVLTIEDPDGMTLELFEVADAEPGRLHEITIAESEAGTTGELLVRQLGFERIEENVFTVGGNRIRVIHDPNSERGLVAPGGVHHLALRVQGLDELQDWRARLIAAGFKVTLVQDRVYFQSIYFRQPRGVLFEIATSAPGFFVDEERLGSRLCLPPWLEANRASIESRLAPVTRFSSE